MVGAPTCPRRNAAKEDLAHLWWTCRALANTRSEALGNRSISFTNLPHNLALHSLAPQWGNNIRQAVWPTGGDGPQHGAHGANAVAKHSFAHEAAGAHLNTACTENWTLRQLLQHIAGPLAHFAPGPVEAIDEPAPNNIICYTDG